MAMEIGMLAFATYQLAQYIFHVNKSPDNLLLIWGIYFGYFIYKTTYQGMLANYLEKPSTLKSTQDVAWMLKNVKACAVIDAVLSGGVLFIMNKVNELHLGSQIEETTYHIQIAMYVRLGVQALMRLLVQEIKIN